jgi:membrane-anchored glycerophosphoryl diester phosphodiesterase (GDPDase)
MTQKLQNSINNGYNVEIGNYFSRGYEIMKQNLGGYIGYTVIMLLIALIANFIPFINIVSSIVVTPCLVFGFHLVSHAISAKRKVPPFNEFFGGFNYFSKVVIVALLSFVIYLIILIPAISFIGFSVFGTLLTASSTESAAALTAAFAGMGGAIFILMLLTFVAFLYVGVSLMFASMIAVFHNVEVVEAMKLSWKVTTKNWLMWIVMLLALSVMLFIGALFCGVGLLFAFPLYVCTLYVAFEDVCGVPETDGGHNDEISTIGLQLK